MKQANPDRCSSRHERGYALLLVLFLLALLALGTLAALPNPKTEGQREKEEEMIWRGKQYVRGIRLYYQKTHKFPTQLEDLYKPKTGIRFLRQAYKDPMNPSDGSWRLIYVGPNGQLIGSLKNRPLTPVGQTGQGFGGSTGLSSFGTSSFGGSSSGNSSFGNSPFNNSSFGGNATTTANPGANSSVAGGLNQQSVQGPNDPNAQNSSSMGEMSTPQSLATPDSSTTPTIIGGNIIGVGSKINQRSFIWYDKARNYRQFEFVWDPSIDAVTGQSIGTVPQNPSPFGSSPASSSPGSPFSTGAPNTNPGQNPSTNPGMNGPANNQGLPPLQAPPQ